MIGLAQNIDNLKKEKAQLEFDIDTLMDTKKWYEVELDKKTNTMKSAKHTITKRIKIKMSFYGTYLVIHFIYGNWFISTHTYHE